MRYIIGIDLGTTNSCVSYVDTEQPSLAIQPFRIQQLTFAGTVDSLQTLPSFCYLPGMLEWPPNTLKMPWQQENPSFFVGRFAQEQGAKTPTRLIQSAKSWLCHSSANRREKILPLEAADAARRLSPVEATAHYLSQIKNSWNASVGLNNSELQFEEQEIVLTVPASFDEVARSLTVEAAKLAGFSNMALLEEPQAAFYSWLSYHEKQWEKKLKAGDNILVCDVGGGTTDFSLMNVSDDQGRLSIQRRAVGDHLLLGGDNMDHALTYYLEKKMGRELTTGQWLQLRHEARRVKESLFNSNDAEKVEKITLQGLGSGVIAGSLSFEITKKEVEKLLLDGFFSQQSWEESLKLQKARGLRNMGLPYEDDPSITKHLAIFLHQSHSEKYQGPDYLLFNGGAMKAVIFQKAILDAFKAWYPAKEVQVLPSASLDLAVARGAAYYGKVRRGFGVRIGGGSARGFYLKVKMQEKEQALTLIPQGSEEESKYQPDTIFKLTPNTPVTFQLYHSHVRLDDQPGDVVTIDESELHPLPPIYTILKFGKQHTSEASLEKIPVTLEVAYTALGILELWLLSKQSDHKWKLEFQLKSASGQDNSIAALQQGRKDAIVNAAELQNAAKWIKEVFSAQSLPPKQLVEQLEKSLALPKNEWSLSILRGLYDEIVLYAAQRQRSSEHEQRWWNLAGFLLRPGFGYPFDDHRVKEIWKLILADQKNVKSQEVQIQNWICYRRIAGGLNKGQQNQIAVEIIQSIMPKKNAKIEIKGKAEIYPYSEKIRTLGAMEWLDVSLKMRVGEALIERIEAGQAIDAEFWALARTGARHLLYGSPAAVVPKETIVKWIERLIPIQDERVPFVISQLGRKTDQRELNIPQDVVQRVIAHYAGNPAQDRLREFLTSEINMTSLERDQIFGEHLPLGLSID